MLIVFCQVQLVCFVFHSDNNTTARCIYQSGLVPASVPELCAVISIHISCETEQHAGQCQSLGTYFIPVKHGGSITSDTTPACRVVFLSVYIRVAHGAVSTNSITTPACRVAFLFVYVRVALGGVSTASVPTPACRVAFLSAYARVALGGVPTASVSG